MTILEPRLNQGCGCDSLGGETLISIDQALIQIARAAAPIDRTQTIALQDAVGRVLLDVVRARGMVPPFNNAAMDGYAIHTDDLEGDGPWDLPVRDRIPAGQAAGAALVRNAAVQIFTGAPVPDGANAVVMQEHVERHAEGIRLGKAVQPGAHIRSAGEDMTAGKIIVPAGRALTARDIAACAAAGHDSVKVRDCLRVALLVTGNELRQSGRARGAACIWDVNTPMLQAAIASPSVQVCEVQHAADTRDALRAQLSELSQKVDLIVTTGGVSVGEEDHVKPALSDLNARVTFSGVALKPGKPVSFGQLDGTYWLGLPGNPLSALVTWHLFGKALIQALTGQVAKSAPRRHVVLSCALQHKPGRCEMRLARIVGHDALGRDVADFADATHSGRVSTLPEMDGMLLVPAEADMLPEGALVEFTPF
ncbi:gephyrin-like molybdotransferase Glp [Cognatishimia sp. MH4019]|uniref:molybdopterin molybdotransferase MoeA n=1 Tax=Cognatishimia sp. MH4019 TaxID=2854030 RepID=UPI001CD632F4|nr:gephyrin-like molybdotransferase Glp [Cognatishimia sp. MH4019]